MPLSPFITPIEESYNSSNYTSPHLVRVSQSVVPPLLFLLGRGFLCRRGC